MFIVDSWMKSPTNSAGLLKETPSGKGMKILFTSPALSTTNSISLLSTKNIAAWWWKLIHYFLGANNKCRPYTYPSSHPFDYNSGNLVLSKISDMENAFRYTNAQDYFFNAIKGECFFPISRVLYHLEENINPPRKTLCSQTILQRIKVITVYIFSIMVMSSHPDPNWTILQVSTTNTGIW